MAGSIGHTCGVKVQKVQRVVVSPSRAMSFIMPPSAVTSTSSIIIILTPVHPFATSWPSSPKGDARGVTGLAFLCHRGSGKRIADSRAARSYGMMGVLLSYLPASAGQTKCRLLSITCLSLLATERDGRGLRRSLFNDQWRSSPAPRMPHKKTSPKGRFFIFYSRRFCG